MLINLLIFAFFIVSLRSFRCRLIELPKNKMSKVTHRQVNRVHRRYYRLCHCRRRRRVCQLSVSHNNTVQQQQ